MENHEVVTENGLLIVKRVPIIPRLYNCGIIIYVICNIRAIYPPDVPVRHLMDFRAIRFVSVPSSSVVAICSSIFFSNDSWSPIVLDSRILLAKTIASTKV